MINEPCGDRTDMRSQLWKDGRTADRRVRWTATRRNRTVPLPSNVESAVYKFELFNRKESDSHHDLESHALSRVPLLSTKNNLDPRLSLSSNAKRRATLPYVPSGHRVFQLTERNIKIRAGWHSLWLRGPNPAI